MLTRLFCLTVKLRHIILLYMFRHIQFVRDKFSNFLKHFALQRFNFSSASPSSATLQIAMLIERKIMQKAIKLITRV